MTVRRLTNVLLAALLAATTLGAAATAAPAPLDLPAPPAPSDGAGQQVQPHPGLERLLGQLQQFRQTRPRGTAGIAVTAGDGSLTASRRANLPLLPASTTKLVTAAAALRILGPDHRFVTRVYATRAPDASGTVHGDLVLVGGGDPALVTPTYRRRIDGARPATSLRRLAARTAHAGITRVTGRVRGDASILADQPLAVGWSRSYLTSLDARPTAGLTVDAGLRLFRRDGVLRAAPATVPARRAAAELTRLLDRRGVRTDGPALTGHRPADGVEVARISSPRLSDLLTHMLRSSDNHLADGIFRMLGAATGDPTWRGSARAATAALADAGIAWDRLRLADGSGLSRRDRLSARALTQVLAAMADGSHRRAWLRMLPIAGRTGTMAGRLTGTQAVGRVHAKTGTLRDVRALAATVPGRDGHDHHVVVLANALRSYDDVLAARRLADVLALAVVAAEDGCRRPLRAPEGARERRPPEHRICGKPRAPRNGAGPRRSRR